MQKSNMSGQTSRTLPWRMCCATALVWLSCYCASGSQTNEPNKSERENSNDVEFCSQWLPRGAEAAILRSTSSYVKVTSVSLVILKPSWGGPGHDLLGVTLSIQTKVGWEGVVHHEMVLRKRSDETTWAKAEVYFFLPGGNAESLWKWFDLGASWNLMREDIKNVREQ